MTVQLDELIQELESSPDDESRRRVFKAVKAVLDFEREGFRRVLEILRESGQEELITRLLEDPLLESILRGYRLVEVNLERKVAAVLARLGHGADVKILGVQSGVARLEASADPATWMAIKKRIESALREEVPELVGLTVARKEPLADGRVPLTAGKVPLPASAREWLPLVHSWELEQESRQRVQLFEEDLLVCGANGRAFVFHNRCPAGGEDLEKALLEGFILTCPGHGYSFDLRSGHCMEKTDVKLPLLPVRLVDGVVQVARECPS